MKQPDNRGALRLTKKGLCIALGSVLGAALIAWILLIVGIFGKDKKKEREAFAWTPPVYDIPEVPEGYKLVFKEKKVYDVSEYGKKTLRVSYEYDKNGNELLYCDYDENGKIKGRIERTYDAQNREISLKETDADWNIIGEAAYIYDQNGKLIERSQNYDTSSYYLGQPREVYQYDADGTLCSSVFYGTDGAVIYKNTYYPNGNLQKMTEYPYSGNEFCFNEYLYDEDENLLTCTKTDYDEVCVTQENSYSEDGVLLETIERLVPETRTAYSYDESGLLSKKTIWSNGILSKEFFYENGLETEVYSYREDGSRQIILQTEYSDNGERIQTGYDEEGNIRRRSVSKLGTEERREESWHVEISGKSVPSSIEEYDEYGFLIALTLYRDRTGPLHYEYEYDDRERWKELKDRGENTSFKASKTTVRDADGEVICYYIREFNKDNNYTKLMYYNPDGTDLYVIEESGYNGTTADYDDYGNCVREIYYHFGRGDVQKIYEYEPFAVPITEE
ncbi:MAG: hypothetical protein J5643_05580 [Lachnospiraceae bacterium]|nr:hypothetical protein [Lachnospiraceae bacterium]